jgi:hypothetical protein
MKLIGVSVTVPDEDSGVVRSVIVALLDRLRDEYPGLTYSIDEETKGDVDP